MSNRKRPISRPSIIDDWDLGPARFGSLGQGDAMSPDASAEQTRRKRAYERVRAMGRMAGRHRLVLDWRTRRGHHAAAVRRLELLRVALGAQGWRCAGLYDRPEFRFPAPLLWVYADGAPGDVGAVVRVRALPGGNWGYFEAGDGREGFIWPCEDAKAAAGALDLLLQHRLLLEARAGDGPR